MLCRECPATRTRAAIIGRVVLGAQRPVVVKLSRGRSVGQCVGSYVRPSVCPVHCGKTADRIRLPFGVIGRTGPGMRQVMGFWDRSMGRGIFGGEFGVINGNFTAYVCDSAATRPSSQITLGRLVNGTLPCARAVGCSAWAPLSIFWGIPTTFPVLLGRVALGAQRSIVIKLSRGRSVGLCVGPCVGTSVCPVHCGTRVIAVSCGIKIFAVRCLILSQYTHLTDRQTDRQNCDSNTVRCITCSRTVKTADRIRMPFGIIGRSGPGMRQVEAH